jgi:tetratricopeptide (TPR) repeat protein
MAKERFGDAKGELQDVLQGAPNTIEALDALGLCYMKLDRLDEAAAIFEDVIQRDAGYQQAHLHLAELLDMRGDYHGAMQCLEQAQAMVTQPLDVIAALVSLYHSYGMHYQAIRLCDEALNLYPDNFDIRYFRVLSLADFGKFDEALDGVKALESEESGEVKLIGTHASLLERMGNYDDAHEMILPYINEQKIPGSIVTTFMRLCHRYDECDQAEILVNILLAKPDLNPELRRGLLFNMVKLKDRLGDYDAAFACAREANELKPCLYDHAQYVDYIDRLLDPVILSLAEEPMIAVARNEGVRPVFIVGMPRSGTSLVEQIIATHPQAYGGGERHAISSIVTSLPGWLGNVAEYPECLAAVSPDTIEQILASYAQFTEKLPEGTLVMTDKMPENFQHLVLIRMLFPDSRIIHCLRDPIDTCLSCYLQQFTGYHEYAYGLGNLGRHYREYQRLMKHYRDDAGIPMLEVQYEELVTNTEEVSRKMVEYCGLEWDERCLKFYESDRIVHTASYDQVKQPVYTRSVGRWKNYERYLQPLMDALQF